MHVKFQLIKNIDDISYVYDIDTNDVDDVVEDMRQFFSYELVTNKLSLSQFLKNGGHNIQFSPTEGCPEEILPYLNSKFKESLDGFLAMLDELHFELDTYSVDETQMCIDSYVLHDA